MGKLYFATVVSLAIAALVVQAQNAPAPQAPTADPYANNPDPGASQFPLAAPAGKDSGALQTAPPGAVNQGPFDPGHLEVRTRVRRRPRARRSGIRSSSR